MQTFTAHEYLMIDVGSTFGLDKEDWDVRLNWTQENRGRLDSLVSKAEEPAMFFAASRALEKAEKGEAIGYPINLDGTASCLQILAALVECEASAKLCNVVSTGHREDAYTNLYRNMNQRRGGKGREISREQLKKAVMPSLFGSEEEPAKAFGDEETLALYVQTMEQDAPGAWALRNALLSMLPPYTEHYSWVMPDNFHVHKWTEGTEQVPFTFHDQVFKLTRSVRKPVKKDRSLAANTAHAVDAMLVRELHRRCSYDPAQLAGAWELVINKAHGTSSHRKKDELLVRLWGHYKASGFLSARILDCLDERNFGMVEASVIAELLGTFPAKPFPVISIHDCFRVHPNRGNDLRRMYNRLLHEIARSNLLSFMVSQVAGKPVEVTKYGAIADRILDADYALS